jgi:polyisoprenoid-binding protein YceI
MSTAAAATKVSTWNIDPAHTTIEFAAKHMMITTVRGRIADLRGSIEVNEGNPNASHTEVAMEAKSLDTRNEQRDTHLRSGDFLDVEKWTHITFRSTKVEGARAKEGSQFKVVGDLTIKDVTKQITLDVTYEGRGKDPWGGERVSFSADAKIDRREWGLTWNAALETGGVLVSNEIKIHIDVQAVKAA